MKATEKWLKQLLAVLETLDDMAIGERERATIRRACRESLIEAEDDIQDQYEHRNSGQKWSKEDLQTLELDLTAAPVCKTYGEEKMILLMLSERLGRPEKILKAKAVELGYASKVDYWMNRD